MFLSQICFETFAVNGGVTARRAFVLSCLTSPYCSRFFEKGATVVEHILDESDAVGLMQLQCKESKDDVSAMIFPTTDTLSLQNQVMRNSAILQCLLCFPMELNPFTLKKSYTLFSILLFSKAWVQLI